MRVHNNMDQQLRRLYRDTLHLRLEGIRIARQVILTISGRRLQSLLKTTTWWLVLAALLTLLGCGTMPPREPSPTIHVGLSNLDAVLARIASTKKPQSLIIDEPLTLTADNGTWTVKDLSFSDRGVIYLGRTNLSLNVLGTIQPSRDGQVLFASFPPGQLTQRAGEDGLAGPPGGSANFPAGAGSQGGKGGDGANGIDGQDSGDLVLQLHHMPSKPFGITLLGQNGGRGGAGGSGGPGGPGQKGRQGDSGPFGCNRGGDNGGSGGGGGDGGTGGQGGACGSGGTATLLVPASLKVSTLKLISLDLTAAHSGPSGLPGSGGAGGDGGDGGDGRGFCGGGTHGPRGIPGGSGNMRPPNLVRCKAPKLITADVN
jgi:hypothetical protein